MNNYAWTAMLGVMGGALKTCINCEQNFQTARMFTYPSLNTSSAGKPRISTEPGIDLSSSTATLARCVLEGGFQKSAFETYLIPQTIKDCPRRQSPAAKTPSTLVEYFCKGLSDVCEDDVVQSYLERRLDIRTSVLLDA